jgi:DNA invertase Pin-like site-specific DNA recombinase
MQVGYIRVSTEEQNLDLQKDALTAAGCERLFSDTATGATTYRPGLNEALNFLRSGDELTVWRLDRLGRSLVHLIDTVNLLEKRGVSFKSLNENIDTTTSTGKLVFHLFGALAEFERDLIRERTKAGLKAARARGRLGGHPRAHTLNTPDKVALAQTLYDSRQASIMEICDTLRVSRATLYRYIKTDQEQKENVHEANL